MKYWKLVAAIVFISFTVYYSIAIYDSEASYRDVISERAITIINWGDANQNAMRVALQAKDDPIADEKRRILPSGYRLATLKLEDEYGLFHYVPCIEGEKRVKGPFECVLVYKERVYYLKTDGAAGFVNTKYHVVDSQARYSNASGFASLCLQNDVSDAILIDGKIPENTGIKAVP